MTEVGTDIQGRLLPTAIKTIIRSNFPKLRHCYETGLKRDAKLTGIVSVTFIIDGNGSVEDARINDTSTLPDPEVRECIRVMYRGLVFPPPDSGKVRVTYPVDFQAGEGPV